MKTRESWLQNGIFIYKTGFLSYKRDSRLAIYQRAFQNKQNAKYN